ncbi:MAG: DUF488 family protein [Desulfovermiculus sp.]|nr:DUF488 family protein [Desulfovermiculus sp.]
MNIKLKRVYSSMDKDDGVRVLVDQVWPRGISKDKLQADIWLFFVTRVLPRNVSSCGSCHSLKKFHWINLSSIRFAVLIII